MSEHTAVAAQKNTTALSWWTTELTNMVSQDYMDCGVQFDEYSKKCAMSAMTNIYQLVKTSGVDIKTMDTSNLREIVGQCASLKLNANAVPRECYFQLRKKKIGNCEFPYKSRVMATREPLKTLKAPYMARNPVKWGFFRLKG